MKIKSARYMNSSRTMIYAEVESEDGSVSTLNIQAPANNEIGVNPVFDKIVEQFTLEKLSEDFKQVELQHHRRKQYETQKIQSEAERKKMTILLEKKAQAFESPIVEAVNSRVLRTSIRKAKTEQQINQIILAALVSYVVENKLSIEDSIALVNGEPLSAPVETHAFFDKDTVQETTAEFIDDSTDPVV